MYPSEVAVKQSAGSSVVRPAYARWSHLPPLILLAVVDVVLRFHHLTSKPFWFDECFSVEVARIGWANFFHLLWWREANMSLYYLLLRIWLHLGQSEFLIRSLSVSISAATLPAIYWLAKSLYERRVGLIAAALLAFNAYDVRYAQEARSYALFLLLATISSAFLVEYLRTANRSSRLGYILVSILAVYAHFYALLLIATQWLAVRILGMPGDEEQARDETARNLRLAWTVIGIAVLPLLIFIAKTGAGPIRWIPKPRLRDLLLLFENLSGTASWPLPAIFALACLVAIAPFGRLIPDRDLEYQAWRSRFLLILLLFPGVLTFLLSFARPVFLARYMIFCLPALLVLVAAGLARLRQAWLLAVALTGILCLSSQGVSWVYGHDFDTERDASGAATNFILDHARPGDAALFHIAETRVPYEFFRSVRAGANTASAQSQTQIGPQILFPRHGMGLDYRDFTGKPSIELLRSEAPGYARIWVMLMDNGPAGHPDATTVLLAQVLSESFPKRQCWGFTKVDVCLYGKD